MHHREHCDTCEGDQTENNHRFFRLQRVRHNHDEQPGIDDRHHHHDPSFHREFADMHLRKILDHQAHCVGQCRKSHGNQTPLGNQQGEDEEYNHTSRADRPTDLNQKLR